MNGKYVNPREVYTFRPAVDVDDDWQSLDDLLSELEMMWQTEWDIPDEHFDLFDGDLLTWESDAWQTTGS